MWRGEALREWVSARDRVAEAALAWDEDPGDRDLCVALSDACAELRRAHAAWIQAGKGE